MWLKERKDWRKDETTLKQIDKFNHAMSNFRYAIENIKKLRKKYNRNKKALPGAKARKYRQGQVRIVRTQAQSGPVGYRGKDEFSQWRASLGEPINERNS
jgi:hypothetical protein